MAAYGSHFWKKAPFVKLLLAMMAGIMVQWKYQAGLSAWGMVVAITVAILLLFFLLPFFNRYRFSFISGIVSSILFFSLGALLTWKKDIRNNKHWLGNFYRPATALLVTLEEPPVQKTKSVKATATVSQLLKNGKMIPVKGKIILYFNKDSLPPLAYGTQLIFTRPLQEIKNAGNPGGFDYKRYSLFHGITHQVYLKKDEFEILNRKNVNWLRQFVYSSRESVLQILRNNIKGHKELGLAEALLIGYKDDLEQSLVQSYTNTGVVHIIAVSGLHLGLIYWLLALVLKPLKKKRRTRWLSPVLVISGLWLFSLLAGAQPSILRSALMFTCIVIGESLSRKTSIYNTIAVSAFILLCINPYWLWDVGFQLSYAAVLSIVIFMRPIYNWFYIKNKLLDFFWKLNAITLAAQILTVPVSVYHFHQFPNLFILTNFLAVPLSSAILLGEIFLCTLSFLPAVAILLGKLLSWLIWLMNTYIERIETLSFSLWDGLQITMLQAMLMILFVAAVSYWLLEKSTRGLQLGLFFLLAFVALRSYSFLQASQQQKIIVYNVSRKRAIDIVGGRQYFFVGDSDLLNNEFSSNFHLKPSRILHRVKDTDSLPGLSVQEDCLDYHGKRILLLDKPISFEQAGSKPAIDLLVISKNPKVYMKKLAAALDIRQVVFDGSVPAWKANYWKKDCDSLQIPWHDVTTKGAFIMKME